MEKSKKRKVVIDLTEENVIEIKEKSPKSNDLEIIELEDSPRKREPEIIEIPAETRDGGQNFVLPSYSNLTTPPNLFGKHGTVEDYLNARRRARAREEEAVVKAIAESIRQEEKSKQVESLKKMQDQEYIDGLEQDKKKLKEENEKREKQEERWRMLQSIFQEDEPLDDYCMVMFQEENRFERAFDKNDLCEKLYLYVEWKRSEQQKEALERSFELLQLPNTVIDRGERISKYGTKRLLLFVRNEA